MLNSAIHRVALARAVYARTKYVLLDDPFSAVVRLSFSSCRLTNTICRTATHLGSYMNDF